MNKLTNNQIEKGSDFITVERDWRETEHPFTVAISVATVGPSREADGWQGQRVSFAGNMSENYAQPDRRDLDDVTASKQATSEQKETMSQEAKDHTARFIESSRA